MYENISLEQFEEIIKGLVDPYYSIGVHGIAKGNEKDKAESIMNTGLRMSIHHKGLTGTISFYGQIRNCNYSKVYNYSYDVSKDGKVYKVICIIPDVLTAYGKSFYVGHYFPFNGLGKDDSRAKLPIENLTILPNELILGCMTTSKTGEVDFILNKKCIEYIENKECKEKVDSLLLHKIINENNKIVFTLDEEGYNKYERYMRIRSDDNVPTYYKLYKEKYDNELNKSIKIM